VVEIASELPPADVMVTVAMEVTEPEELVAVRV
jgi:hypothetical protein